ncbi:MAG: transcription antitermination factor NusB [Akkermansiaceae bacterium]|nr:transcription antitermination factor NusB [Akkermansiaceae bacterium]
MIQESSLRKLALAKAKAILHVAQGRDNRLARLVDKSPACLAELKAANGTAEIISALNKILTRENKLTESIKSLKTAVHSKSGDPLASHTIEDVINTNRSLTGLRATWHQVIEDFPTWKNKLEVITAAINHLQRVSERLDAIEDPDSTVGDFVHLRASSSEITLFRRETQTLVQGILNNKARIDDALARIVENFAPERVDPVDRAILRLATFEIQNCDDIPRAVSINEAIEIAKKFGTTDSARFINGVLDAL